jgi:hypothetical protein
VRFDDLDALNPRERRRLGPRLCWACEAVVLGDRIDWNDPLYKAIGDKLSKAFRDLEVARFNDKLVRRGLKPVEA